MFGLKLTTSTGASIIFENSAWICAHRTEILSMAAEKISNENELHFNSEEEMHNFATMIYQLKD